MTTETATTDSIRKAAILVSALDRDSADAILDKMGPAQAARVRNAVFELESISDQEQDRIVREFVSAGGAASGLVAAGDQDQSRNWDFAPQPFRLPPHDETTPPRELSSADRPSTTPSQAEANSRAHPTGAHPTGAHPSGDEPSGDDPNKDAAPFPILREASVETLANHLADENAQVIAVVVAHLPPRRAADLLAQLAPPLQADVLRRVAALDAAAPEAMEVLQRQLETKLAEDVRAQRNRTAGLATVNSILSAAGDNRKEILDNLTRNDHQLSQLVAASDAETAPSGASHSAPAQKDIAATSAAAKAGTTKTTAPEKSASVQRDSGERASSAQDINEPDNPAEASSASDGPALHVPMAGLDDEAVPAATATTPDVDPIPFERLVDLDDHELALLFREIDPAVTLVALAGASPEFVDRVMRPLPHREAKTLRRKMERLGPIRLSDIVAAQHKVARTAMRMVRDGSLPRPVSPRFAVAA